MEQVFTQFPEHPYPRPGRTYISACVKYAIFFFNFVFWFVGLVLIGVGLYALFDQWQSGAPVRVETVTDVLFNLGLVITIFGALIFLVSWAGCVGALRENTLLLQFYAVALLIFLLLEITLAVLGLFYPGKMEGIISTYLTDNVIKKYRDDVDLQNLIDFVQTRFRCCGLSTRSFEDWSKNEYFNCTEPQWNPSVERCGVPYSCCRNTTDVSSGLINIMCGYGVQEDWALGHKDPKDRVWTQGCIEALKSWINPNLEVVAGSALAVAFMQLFVGYLAATLKEQIEMQQGTWS